MKRIRLRPNPLDQAERDGIVLAVKSASTKLRNLYAKIAPVFNSYGFRAPSAAVVARDLSDKIETSFIQHCPSFERNAIALNMFRSESAIEVLFQSKRVAK